MLHERTFAIPMKDIADQQNHHIHRLLNQKNPETLHAIFIPSATKTSVRLHNPFGCKLETFGDPKSFNASVFRSERASHRNRCDFAMLDLPGDADCDLVHVPHQARGARHTKLAAVLRDRRHLVQLLDDEEARSRFLAASRYLPQLVASMGGHTH